MWVVLVCVLCWFAGSFVARGLPGVAVLGLIVVCFAVGCLVGC